MVSSDDGHVSAFSNQLTRIDVDGDREVIAVDVELFVVPCHGSDRELDEVLFSVRHPERGGLWRHVLP